MEGLPGHPKACDLAISALAPGMTASFEVWIDDAVIDAFAAVSGDFNDLHVDADYARSRGFRDRVAHGFLIGSKFSALVGMFLPGKRCLLLEQTLAFPNPVFPGDCVLVQGEISELWPEQNSMKLKFRASRLEQGKTITVARGSALCKTLY